MKSKMLSLLFLTTILVASCQKNSEPAPTNDATSGKTVNLLLGYYNFIHQNSDVYMNVGTYATVPTQNEVDKSLTANAAAKNASNALQSASIGGHNLASDPNTTNGLINVDYLQLKNIYGTNAVFSFVADGVTNSKTLYIPKVLNLNLNSEQTNNLELRAGTVLNWNKDENNVKGVVFILAYDPFHSPLTKEAYPKRITKMIGATDNGSYTLKQSDVEGLPLNGRIKVSAGRAGFEVYQPQNSTKTYSLYGYTLVDAMGIIK